MLAMEAVSPRIDEVGAFQRKHADDALGEFVLPIAKDMVFHPTVFSELLFYW
uniref:Uncharacterized protein n=1 Tax=uncultured verrucomicrobium HF0500_27H16 TaxID=723600 RepID=E7C5J8_9BACT|nr:hypothetical protein [uncultured verrucomicrobium HF0500_27H16]